jgi:hypothetical protein
MFENGELEGVYLDYIIEDWTIVSSISVRPVAAKKLEGLDLFAPSPPQTELDLILKDGRSIYTNKDGEIAKLGGRFHLKINGNDKGVSEGAVRHSHADEGYEENLSGGISIPNDQFEWLLGELAKPNARLHLWLHVPMIDKKALPYGKDVALFGFILNVSYGPKAAQKMVAPVPAPITSPPDSPSPARPDDNLKAVILLLVILVGLTAYIAFKSFPIG